MNAERVRGLMMLAGIAFLVVVAGFFLVSWFTGQNQAAVARRAIIQDQDFHRCRTEQLFEELFAKQGLPVPPYPDGIEPPAGCPVTGGAGRTLPRVSPTQKELR